MVGVDPGGCEGALEYAAADAERRGTGVHLVHVLRPPGWWASDSDLLAREAGDLRDRGHRLLSESAARTHELWGSAECPLTPAVSTELSQGSAVAVLGTLSREAEVVVLQHHGWGPRGETSTLSVTAGLAAVSHAPVVAVPDRWRSPVSPGRVLVAVDDPLVDRAVLDAAAAEARRRGVELTAVQVAAVGCPEPRLFAGTDVPLTVVSSSLAPPDVLAELTDGCDLLVVGRHHRRHVVGAILGRTVRDLLRRLDVPVLVVDPLDLTAGGRTRPIPVSALPGA
jgi:nucleotide-binding universal stress UspA family protein